MDERLVDQAERLARERGMIFVAGSTDVGGLCKVYCHRCGWGRDFPNDGFDVVLSAYVAEPYGCAPCGIRSRDEADEKARRRMARGAVR